jgi:hypothetical protein
MSVYGSGLLLAVLLELLAVLNVDVLLLDVVVGGMVAEDDDELEDELGAEDKEVDEEEDASDEDEEDEEEDCDTEFFVYTESRRPAPQSSNAFPLHVKLQSVAGAGIEPALKELPQ